jgi:hypothetical protein
MESPALISIPATVRVDGIEIDVARVTSVDTMARRSLADDMPGIIIRAWTRAIIKGAAEHAANKKNQNEWAAFLIGLAGELTEKADERSWRTLPAEIAFARVTLPHGSHALSLPSGDGLRQFLVNATGTHALVSVRQLGNRLVVRAAPGLLSTAPDAIEAPRVALEPGEPHPPVSHLSHLRKEALP